MRRSGGKHLLNVDDSARHRYARRPSLRLRRKEGGNFFVSDIFPRQQNSFGRKRTEQWWPVWLQGHSKFLLKRRETCERSRAK
jgi:hypothetical protein